MIHGSKTVSDTVLKHDLCELVIAEVRSAITNDGTGVPNLANRDFKNLQTTRASLVGSAFASTHFDKYSTATNCGLIEFGVKHLLGGVVRAMMSPDGSIVASLENVNGFLTVYTPSDHLIRTDFEQEGVVPKVMLHIFEELVLLLGRHSLNNEIPRMVKGNDVGGYTQRFYELALTCTKFIFNEAEKVDKYISRLPDNIHGNVMSARPKTLDDAIELANYLMDQKLRTYAERQAENKGKLDNKNQAQQQLLKKQNVVQAYAV
nr:hypothetical protein [Tanacetum cinerariifolium]